MRGQRDIFSRLGSQELSDVLQSVLSIELMAPSPVIWLISPYVTDLPVLDNTARQFSSLQPEWSQSMIRLSEVLRAFAERDAEVRLITSTKTASATFLQKMRAAEAELPEKIKVDVSDQDIHEKGLLTGRFHLAGSFNFTVSGVRKRRERARLTTVEADLARARIEFLEEWKRFRGDGF